MAGDADASVLLDFSVITTDSPGEGVIAGSASNADEENVRSEPDGVFVIECNLVSVPQLLELTADDLSLGLCP